MAPFGSIKKQIAYFKKEKRKVSHGDDFLHPLAYAPRAKGKGDAIREKFILDKKGTMDSLKIAGLKKKKTVPQKKPSNVQFSTDHGSSVLSYSHIKPSGPGNFVSDVYVQPSSFVSRPTQPASSAPRDTEDNNDYHKEVKLGIRVNTPQVAPQLPPQPPEVFHEPPEYTTEDIFANVPIDYYKLEGTAEESPKVETVQEDKPQKYSQIEFDKEKVEKVKVRAEKEKPKADNYQMTGTRVKKSFKPKAPPTPVKVISKPEPWEKAGKVSIPPYNREEGAGWGEINVPIFPVFGKNKKEEKTEIISDYEPAASQEYVPTSPKATPAIDLRKKQPEVIQEKEVAASHEEPVRETQEDVVDDYTSIDLPIQETKEKRSYKLFSKIKDSLSSSDNTKVIDFSFQDGKTDKEEIVEKKQEVTQEKQDEFLKDWGREEVKKDRFKWLKNILTPKEKKALSYTRRPVSNLSTRFFSWKTDNARRSAAVLGIGLCFSLIVPLGSYVYKVIEAKNKIETSSEQAYTDAQNAQSAMLAVNPEEASKNFGSAYNNFLTASQSLDAVGGGILTIAKVLPGGGKIKSGEHLLKGGEHLALSGQIMSEAFDLFLGKDGALRKKLLETGNLSDLEELTTYSPPEKNEEAESLTNAIILFQEKVAKAKVELESANESFQKVNVDDLPEDKKDQFVKLQSQLPTIITSLDSFSSYTNILLTILGHNEPKRYLFLFQNNHEMRATGGFIGTYGIIKINEGNISQLFVEGIYNPDGQLKERIIPPKPIQKMSATWSMHDANWWPDFPKSAEKVAWFYEKTGGPTVDGVIALTPPVIEKFLEITGPIEMEEYGITIDSENFVDITQYKVEVDYDKKLNRPKQILADLTPILLEKIFSAPPSQWLEVMQIFNESLEERFILMYFFDYNVQEAVSDMGWSGEILDTPKDYLMVNNTNISGMKTDKMVEQNIEHISEIQPDGSIIDEVTIYRTHKGGNEKEEWYNAVNSNWQRIYVPEGSELISAEGYTREVSAAPVNYEKLEFIEDEMVTMEESSMRLDEYTGTRIYTDSGKTVFANWTYVSPGETLVIKYKYLLPFKLRFDEIKKPADTYSLLVQKQAGDENSWVHSQVKGLENFKILYHSPSNIQVPNWNINTKFTKDIFGGAVLTEKDSDN